MQAASRLTKDEPRTIGMTIRRTEAGHIESYTITGHNTVTETKNLAVCIATAHVRIASQGVETAGDEYRITGHSSRGADARTGHNLRRNHRTTPKGESMNLNAFNAQMQQMFLWLLLIEVIGAALAMWAVYWITKAAIREGIKESGLIDVLSRQAREPALRDTRPAGIEDMTAR